MKHLRTWAIVALFLLLGWSGFPAARSDSNAYPNCRFGVCATDSITSYDVAQLNAGWYLDWGARLSPARPDGMEFVQMIRLRQTGAETYTFWPSGSSLEAIVDSNRGSLWMIGNEPDCIWQDDVEPGVYARAYHEVHTLLKDRDPTARVAIGAIVQPTPLRLQYLDMVWEAHQALYGQRLPTDAWNIHSFILREKRDPPGNWGAGIPPGISAAEGELYDLRDTDDVSIFRQRIVDFREWMRDKGEQDKPLLVSEYGLLFPSDYFDEDGRFFDHQRVRTFMYATFDFFLTATDTSLGYPPDDHRLVQRWAWYSLSDNVYNGSLFDPGTKQIGPLGQDYGAYVDGLPRRPDLEVTQVKVSPPVPFSSGEPVSLTVQVSVTNVGPVSVTQPVAVRFYGDTVPQGGDQVVPSGLCGCAEQAAVQWTWAGVLPGVHSLRLVVDPEGNVAESDETNNEFTSSVLVATHRQFLPLIMSGRPLGLSSR